MRSVLVFSLTVAWAGVARAEAPAAPASPSAPAVPPEAPAAAPGPAAAPQRPAFTSPYTESPYFPVPTTRRYGFKFSASAGLTLMQASGSPVKFNQRSDTVDTGIVPGFGYTVTIGGVFTDWFAFHLGLSTAGATKGDHQNGVTAFIMGLETWPLFSLGGVWRDVGIGADFGTGSASVKSKASGETLADGGGMSMIRATVFWDALRAGRWNFGPYVAYEHHDAETYAGNVGWIGVRTAFYGVSE